MRTLGLPQLSKQTMDSSIMKGDVRYPKKNVWTGSYF